jgi:hypothetical protein
VLSLANSLQQSEKFYLLHDEITKAFITAKDDLSEDHEQCRHVIAMNGAAELTVEAKNLSSKIAAVRKHVAVLTNMLASLARR